MAWGPSEDKTWVVWRSGKFVWGNKVMGDEKRVDRGIEKGDIGWREI